LVLDNNARSKTVDLQSRVLAQSRAGDGRFQGAMGGDHELRPPAVYGEGSARGRLVRFGGDLNPDWRRACDQPINEWLWIGQENDYRIAAQAAGG
jgi:hypothetical protein